jgi:hypothetical protein
LKFHIASFRPASSKPFVADCGIVQALNVTGKGMGCGTVRFQRVVNLAITRPKRQWLSHHTAWRLSGLACVVAARPSHEGACED